MTQFQATIVGGGPYDGSEMIVDKPPANGCHAVTPDGCVYQFDETRRRWVFVEKRSWFEKRTE